MNIFNWMYMLTKTVLYLLETGNHSHDVTCVYLMKNKITFSIFSASNENMA